MKITRRQLEQKVRRILQEKKGGGWPSEAPKQLPRTEKAGPTPDQVVAAFKQLASLNPPQDAEEQLQQIGGEEKLKDNYKQLSKHFAGADSNPPRIKMPVVEPDKGDIGQDGGDLGDRLEKGELDVKPPFAKEGVQRIAQMVVERLLERRLLAEQSPAQVGAEAAAEADAEEPFPTDLLGKSQAEREEWLTKGTRDGNMQDDSAVTMTPRQIPVSKAFPSQKQVYIDKSLWNILNFTGTKPGGTAFGDADMIAIQQGDTYTILDGHHRWSSAYLSGGPSAKIRVQVLQGLDVPQAIAALRAYGNARGNAQKG